MVRFLLIFFFCNFSKIFVVLVETNQKKEIGDGLNLQKDFKEKKNLLEEMVQVLKNVREIQEIVLLLAEVLNEEKVAEVEEMKVREDTENPDKLYRE